MKKVIVVVAVVICLVMSAYVRASDEASKAGSSKLGYVDLNRALNEVEEGKAAKSRLEADGKAKKQKIEIMQNDLKAMKDDLEKQRLILSAEALRAKEATFQQKFVEFQKMTMDAEKSFTEMETNFIKPISDKLQRVIQKIGQEDGFSLIVPREMALYSLPGTDLTDKVITAYNKTK